MCIKVNGHARGPHHCPRQIVTKERPIYEGFGDRKGIETAEGREGSMDKEILKQVPAGGGGREGVADAPGREHPMNTSLEERTQG